MAEAGRRVADLERQLEQLKSYRDEYVRNSTEGRGAMDAVKLQNYRSFLERLGEALRHHLKNLERHVRLADSVRRVRFKDPLAQGREPGLLPFRCRDG